jgi:streptogramin lyase
VLSRIGLRSIALGLVLGALAAAPAAAVPHVDGEFGIKSTFDGTDTIAEGPEGNMWATVSDATNDVARITPSGEVKEFNLPEVDHPTGIAAGPDGNMWVTLEGGVARFSPATPEDEGTTLKQTITEVKSQSSIAAGPNDRMWVATENNLVSVPLENPLGFKANEIPGLFPHDIDAAGPLIAIADSGLNKIVTATASGGDLATETDFEIGGGEGGSQGVAVNNGGQIGFSQQLHQPEQIGVIAPPGEPQTVDVPATDPFGVALGSDGAFWIAESNTDGVSRLTTDAGAAFLGGFEKPFKPRQIAAGPANTLWVTLENNETSTYRVGRISGLEPPPPPSVGPAPPGAAPDTKITKGPKKRVVTKHKRAKVTFKFASSSPGVSFECALTRLKKTKKKKVRAPHFAACKSPKSFELKLGRYRFEARAVLAGAHDPTPAQRSFRVVHRG